MKSVFSLICLLYLQADLAVGRHDFRCYDQAKALRANFVFWPGDCSRTKFVIVFWSFTQFPFSQTVTKSRDRPSRANDVASWRTRLPSLLPLCLLHQSLINPHCDFVFLRWAFRHVHWCVFARDSVVHPERSVTLKIESMPECDLDLLFSEDDSVLSPTLYLRPVLFSYQQVVSCTKVSQSGVLPHGNCDFFCIFWSYTMLYIA